MDKPLNYYRVLHVQPDAPDEIIRSSYRTLMTTLRRHPDLGGDHLTATAINEAYAVLSNPAKRAAYDDACQSVVANPVNAASAPEPSALCQFCGAAHGFRGRIHDSATCTTCNTPLAPAEHKRLEPGQRAVNRVQKPLALNYFTNWPGRGPYPGETRDISVHGLRFATHTARPVTKLIKVECEALVALVRIVSCDDHDERDWRWLIRSEYVTVRFRRARGGFLATRA
jgi:hypothetical protein